jgi:hypothetical protein
VCIEIAEEAGVESEWDAETVIIRATGSPGIVFSDAVESERSREAGEIPERDIQFWVTDMEGEDIETGVTGEQERWIAEGVEGGVYWFIDGDNIERGGVFGVGARDETETERGWLLEGATYSDEEGTRG